MKSLLRVAVTGGAGQINYNLLFRIASGETFGLDQPVALHILEIPQGMEALKGVVMELQDCAFPLLEEIQIGSNSQEVFAGVHVAILVGAKPRGAGMERKDLLQENGKIFIDQGKALNDVADKNVVVLVVGNPCNTNCLIAMNHAPNLSSSQFYAMTRLDQNRAAYQLAEKAKAKVSDVEDMIIWGNHSATQVPDFFHAKIKKKPALDVIQDQQWLEGDFLKIVQQRGAAIIKARGKSSAASAANAAIDSIKAITLGEQDRVFSTAILSDGNSYGIADGLIFSFPCLHHEWGKVKVVEGMKWNEFLEKKIKASEKELLEERDAIKDLLN